ncbi:hypothetical protein ZHAS_00003473 [Anopheles sinensis]|uniref:Uncharacterized protein n=1 Tax=Anopheles sinensis TaxID=74873 RepID=A0A084VEE8_ANOSI|nr:hypothetical protein ZHAS_00003473 [Anopheles sinensis]
MLLPLQNAQTYARTSQKLSGTDRKTGKNNGFLDGSKCSKEDARIKKQKHPPMVKRPPVGLEIVSTTRSGREFSERPDRRKRRASETLSTSSADIILV